MANQISANPFATRHTRPGAIPFLFAPGESAAACVARLEANGWQGQIVGPHGSGKSTLLAALRPALVAAGRNVFDIELHDGQRRLGFTLDEIPDLEPAGLLIVDGYEQLGWLGSRRLHHCCRRRGWGLLVTAHAPVGLPLLASLAPSLDVARRIVDALVASDGPHVPEAELARLFTAHSGDIREVLFALYGLHESSVQSSCSA